MHQIPVTCRCLHEYGEYSWLPILVLVARCLPNVVHPHINERPPQRVDPMWYYSGR